MELQTVTPTKLKTLYRSLSLPTPVAGDSQDLGPSGELVLRELPVLPQPGNVRGDASAVRHATTQFALSVVNDEKTRVGTESGRKRPARRVPFGVI